tara:strand:+ start:138 stop:527 length:390 start_codon:yes stop_codon:yes gene_type:complete
MLSMNDTHTLNKISKASFLRHIVKHGVTFLGGARIAKEDEALSKFIRDYDTNILTNQDVVVKTYDGFKRACSVKDSYSYCTLGKGDTVYALDKDMYCIESIKHSDTYGLMKSVLLYRSSSKVLDYEGAR